MKERAASMLAIAGALVLAVALLVTTRHCEWVGLAQTAAHACCVGDPDSVPAPGGSCCDVVATGDALTPIAPAAPALALDPGFTAPTAADAVLLAPAPRDWSDGTSPPEPAVFVRVSCRRIAPALAPPLVA